MSYEIHYLKGFLSALFVTALITILFFVLMPPWATFTFSLQNVVSAMVPLYPGLSGYNSFLKSLNASVNVAFFFIILYPLIFLLLLPFLREPQEEATIGGAY